MRSNGTVSIWVTFGIFASCGLSSLAVATITITWLTDERANSLVEYGTTDGYGTVEIDDHSYNAEGVVMWSKIVPPQLVRVVKNGMGIKFTKTDDGLIDYYKNKLHT